jgi:hypothetical protein
MAGPRICSSGVGLDVLLERGRKDHWLPDSRSQTCPSAP